MSIKSKVQELKNKLMGKLMLNPFAQNESGEMTGILKGAIIAIIALVIIVTLGTALLPASIDTLSANMSADHPLWSDGTVSIWSALAIFVVLVFLLILVAILLAVLG